MTPEERRRELRRVWARVPQPVCQGKCAESCGPIAMSPEERRMIEERTGEPFETDFTCPLLKLGLCSVYDIRPMVCRLWGATEGMACPHGCLPPSGRLLTDDEGMAILADAMFIGGEPGAIDGDEMRRRMKDPVLRYVAEGMIATGSRNDRRKMLGG
jgi:hypothetical protein